MRKLRCSSFFVATFKWLSASKVRKISIIFTHFLYIFCTIFIYYWVFHIRFPEIFKHVKISVQVWTLLANVGVIFEISNLKCQLSRGIFPDFFFVNFGQLILKVCGENWEISQTHCTKHHFTALTRFRPVFPCYITWGLMFSGGLEKEHWPENFGFRGVVNLSRNSISRILDFYY